MVQEAIKELTGDVQVQFAGEWFDAVCDDEMDVTSGVSLRRCTLKHSAKAVKHNLVSVTIWVPEDRIQCQLLAKLTAELHEHKEMHYKSQVETLLKELELSQMELDQARRENKKLQVKVSNLKTTKEPSGHERRHSSFASIAALFEDVLEDDKPKPKSKKKRCPSLSISNVLALEEPQSHQRKASYGFVASLDDSDAPSAPKPKSKSTRKVVDSFGGVASLFSKPSQKHRTPSYTNVADLFMSDDEEEQSSLARKPKGVGSFNASVKSSRRQVSSFGGVAALFENWEDDSDTTRSAPKPAVSKPIGTKTSKRKVSFDNIASLFSDE